MPLCLRAAANRFVIQLRNGLSFAHLYNIVRSWLEKIIKAECCG